MQIKAEKSGALFRKSRRAAFLFITISHNFFTFLKNYVKKHLTDSEIGANIKMQ